MSAYPSNNSESAVANILKLASAQAINTTKRAADYVGDYTANYYPSYSTRYQSVSSPQSGTYWMRVLYFMMIYLFIIFLVLVFVHFVVTPIFVFTPGAPGIIKVKALNDNVTYWNKKVQPPPSSMVPIKDDKLYTHAFLNNYSFSIDLFLTKVTSTNPTTRLILYKAKEQKGALPIPTKSKNSTPACSAKITATCATEPDGDSITTLQDFINYMALHSSMIMYLNDTNDLTITIFSGTGQMYSIPYIKNIPLYMPFRITAVFETNMFTAYFNGKQTYQRVISGDIKSNSQNSGVTSNDYFYSAPEWANSPSQSVFLQNFNLWPRAITYNEVLAAQPALALESDFNVGANISATASCNS